MMAIYLTIAMHFLLGINVSVGLMCLYRSIEYGQPNALLLGIANLAAAVWIIYVVYF